MRNRRTLILTIIGFLLIFGGGIGLFGAVQSARNLEAVMATKTDIPPYTPITDSDLQVVNIPRAAVTDQNITQAEYEKNFKTTKSRTLMSTMRILSGTVIDRRYIAKDAVKSFAAVSSDERIVSVSASIQAAAVGTIQAGDVVDVGSANSGSTEGLSTAYAKVLCISVSLTGCRGVLPAGVNLSAVSGGDNLAIGGNNSGEVNLLLAVPEVDATALSGRQVSLALNPFCRFGPDGKFISARPDKECTPPAEREASGGGPGDTTTPADTKTKTTTQDTQTGS